MQFPATNITPAFPGESLLLSDGYKFQSYRWTLPHEANKRFSPEKTVRLHQMHVVENHLKDLIRQSPSPACPTGRSHGSRFQKSSYPPIHSIQKEPH